MGQIIDITKKISVNKKTCSLSYIQRKLLINIISNEKEELSKYLLASNKSEEKFIKSSIKTFNSIVNRLNQYNFSEDSNENFSFIEYDCLLGALGEVVSNGFKGLDDVEINEVVLMTFKMREIYGEFKVEESV